MAVEAPRVSEKGKQRKEEVEGNEPCIVGAECKTPGGNCAVRSRSGLEG